MLKSLWARRNKRERRMKNEVRRKYDKKSSRVDGLERVIAMMVCLNKRHNFGGHFKIKVETIIPI